MRKNHIGLLASSSLVIPCLLVACSSSNGSSGNTSPIPDSGAGADASGARVDGSTSPTADAGSTPPGDSGSTTPSDAGSTAANKALVRVAHLSPGTPAVDFCLAPHGTTTFIGPVLSTIASVSTGVSYKEVTEYLPVAPSQYDVRIVAPGLTSCATGLLPSDITNLPALAANQSYTLAAEGILAADAGVPFALTPYVDDSTVASGKAALRFVHASPGTPAVDVGTGAGSSFAAVFSNVAYGGIAAAGGGIDANGYLVTAPLSGVELSARAHGTTADALIIPSATLPAGAIATAFAIGQLGETSDPLAVLLCVDSAAPTQGLSSCSVVGYSEAQVRVAHLSPDAPAVDVCIAAHGAAFTGVTPLLGSLGADAGLSYPEVTTYVPLPVGAYDLRVVAANAGSCATGIVPDTDGVTVPLTYATIAATGVVAGATDGGEENFALKVFVDESTVAAASTALRFVHASPGTPPVDVGTETDAGASSFSAVFSDVAFGGVAAAASPIDGNGYYVGPPLSAVTIAARAHGATTDAIPPIPGINAPAGSVQTAFAVGILGNTTTPLSVVLCQDNAAPAGLLTKCSAALQ
jgi:hypothetical protein